MKLLILDADVIIHCHEIGIWDQVVKANELYIPSYVYDNEANYFESDNGQTSIDLKSKVDSGEIKIIEAEKKHYDAFYKKLKDPFKEILDPGEKEAIALLSDQDFEDYKFCTGDQTAIKAIAILASTYQGISLEKVLQSSSIKSDKIEPHFKEEAFKKSLGKGAIEKDLWLK